MKKNYLFLTVSSLLSIGLITTSTPIKAQENLDLNVPMNVEYPKDKQDFVRQCTTNLETNGIPKDQAQPYCQCSADVIYSQPNPEAMTNLDPIYKCREYIKPITVPGE
jgi:hypothetical protein